MYLTSVTNLKLTHDQFKIVDTMSYRAKSIYNSTLYVINNHFKTTSKYLNYNDSYKLVKTEYNDLYSSLLSALAQQTVKKLHNNFSSFFALLNKKNSGDYDKNIKTPKYLDKNGRKELIYTRSETSKSFIIKEGWLYITVSKDLHKGRLQLCKFPKYIDENNVKYIEIVPKLNNSYSLHIVYDKAQAELKTENSSWLSIDLGMNNMCTVTSNILKSFILNGRHIKSINQKYNKKIAKLQSVVKKSQNKSKSKQLTELYNKRGAKLNNEINKISDFIVKTCLEKDIDFVVLGYNKEWKQNISLGKRTNQNFVQIPFSKILHQLEYKLQMNGIELFLQEESYTSKTSYFDNEPIQKQQTYKGKRIKRGLFRTGSGILINSDVNGSLNIFRKFINKTKVVNDVLLEPVDTGLVMNPIKINLYTSTSKDDVYKFILSL